MLYLPFVGCAGTTATADKFHTQANFDFCEWHGGRNPSLVMRGVNHSQATRAGVEYVRVITSSLVPVATGAFGGGNAAAAGVGVPLLESLMQNRRLPVEQQTIFHNGQVIKSRVP